MFDVRTTSLMNVRRPDRLSHECQTRSYRYLEGLFAELRTKKLIILSRTPFQNNFEKLRTIMRLLLLANDEAMVFLNPLTLDNVTYRRVDEIRKNMDHFLHIQNGAILLTKSLKG